MQFGVFSVSDITRDPVSGVTPSEAERIDAILRIAAKTEEIGMDVFAIGEHHNPPFFSSSPTTLLAAIAATTKRLIVRLELRSRKDPDSAEAPTHDALVRAKYGDLPSRQPRPNANRGDNVTAGSPYQDSPSA